MAEARVLLERHDVVAVIVNRVARASAVATQLREGAGGTLEVVLLTGRMRPLDRDDVLASLRPRIMTGRERTGDGRKLVVVATQCIEAGADFDFDAMVTECASLDALRQRFGRVDRLGLYARAEGVVICDWSAKDDPIYGTALGATFKWLDAHAEKKKGVKTFDFAVATFPPLSDADVATLFAAKPHAPVLLPAYLDLWSQTSPPPAQVPDLTLWLHGPATSPADVQVVWRADVTDELLDAAARGADESEAGSVEALVDVVGSVRPTSLETLSLPFGVARAWLSGGAVGPMSDVEGDAAEEDHALSGGGRRALLWRGDESRVVRAEEIRPGDTMIVPASRGGLLQGIFEPDATAAVQDLAERATLFGRGLPLLRLHPAILDGLGLPSTWATDEEDVRVAVAAAAVDVAGWRRPWLTALARSSTDRVVVAGDATWTVLEARRLAAPVLRDLVTPAETVEDSAEATTDDEDSPFLGRAVGLREHSIDVEMLARAYATSLGLPHELISDLALAGWLHDIGKADPRFQLLLRGGDEIAWLRDDSLLAKSGISDQDRARQRRARARSGYPAGTRHELQSVAMIEAALGELRGRAHDLDLVLHLVASHHGFCRPLAPASIEVAPVEIAAADHVNTAEETVRLPPTTTDHGLHRVDSPIPGRYWELVQKYGWQELCWLESILRLADHRASEHEQQKGGAGQ